MINKLLNKIIIYLFILFIIVYSLLFVVMYIDYNSKQTFNSYYNAEHTDITYFEENSIKVCIKNILSEEELENRKNIAEQEKLKRIKIIKIVNLQDSQYEEKLNIERFWNSRFDEYYDATYVYKYFKDLGYSDYVCSGILGNMMNECGCNSFNLNPTWYSNGYYGLCMWYYEYNPDVVGTDLEYQCKYLAENLQRRIEAFGYSFEDFINSDSCEEVALMFAKAYEKCSSESYSIKMYNAKQAYEYFLFY